MPARHSDGSAGDANYGLIGTGYARYRQPDPRIADAILSALGDARTVLNVGAGAGSYEPMDRIVIAVEPSASMRAQRPAHRPSAIDAVAEALPFPDAAFDASMATFTVHQWQNLAAGLAGMRRVTRGAVLILTCDPHELDRFWLADYAPEMIAVEASRYPVIGTIVSALGGHSTVTPIHIPWDCTDGFNEAYYARPERLLERGARGACSAWSFIGEPAAARAVDALSDDLKSGAWDRKYGHLRSQATFDGSLKLIVAKPA